MTRRCSSAEHAELLKRGTDLCAWPTSPLFMNIIYSTIQAMRYGLEDLIETMLIFGETKGRKCQTYYLRMELAVQTMGALPHLHLLPRQSPLKVDQAVGTRTSQSWLLHSSAVLLWDSCWSGSIRSGQQRQKQSSQQR